MPLWSLDRELGLVPDPKKPRGLAALDREYRIGGMVDPRGVPTAGIEEATGMELDESRGPMDYLRRAAAAALGGPASVLEMQEAGLRAALPSSVEDIAVRGVTGTTDTLLNKADELTGLPVSRASQDSAQSRFINSGVGGSPVMDALADTALHGAGLLADPANFLPGAALAKPAAAAAPDLARAASGFAKAADDVPLGAREAPGIRPWEMSLDEIDRVLAETKAGERELEAMLFGEEGVKKYRAAQAVSNSMYESRADQEAADRVVEAMEGSLTERQRRLLFGMDENPNSPTADDLRDYSLAMGRLDWSSPDDLGESLKWAISKLPRKPMSEMDPADMTHGQRVAYAQLRHAFTEATREGWDTARVSAAALKGAAGRFGEDASYMLSHFAAGTSGTTAPQRALPASAPQPPGPGGLAMPAAREVTERINLMQAPEVPFQYNLGRLDLDEAGQQEFREVLGEHLPDVMAQRRATQGWNKLGSPERLAQKLGLTPERLMATRAGTAFNDEELAVLDSTLGSVGQKMQELARVVSAGDDSSINKAALGRLREQYVALMKVSVGAGSEAGRALNSLKALKPAMDSDTMTRLALLREHGKSMNDEQIAALASLDPNNPDELFSFLRNFDKPKIGDYVHEAWMSSILSGLGSFERNLVGNSLFAAMEFPVRAARSLVDIPMSAVQGRQREFYMGEVMPAMMGALRGVPKGAARALSILKRGYDDPELIGKLVPPRSSWDRSPNAAVRALSPVVTFPLRALSATDAVFRAMANSAEIAALATRIAVKEGLDGDALAARATELMQSPTTEMFEAAKRYERFSTFTDEMSPLGQLIGKARGVVPGARYIIPFVQVADRLAARGFEFTPVGLVKAYKKGGAEASDLTARATIGSAVMAGFAAYAMDGKVVGAAPSNPGERDLFYRAHKQPYSVKVGDHWVPFSNIDPISTPLTLTAVMMDSFRNNKELPTEQKVLSAVAGIAKNLTDKTYLQGLADLFEAIERGQSSPDAVLDLGARQAGGFMPYSALSRSVATAMDPRVVRTDTIGQRMAANVPGLREGLPARIDVFGEDIVPATGRARGFLPFVPTKETEDPVALALEEAGVSLSFVGNTLNGEELSQEQRDELQRLVGRETRQRLERAIADPDWWLLSRERKAKRLERAIYLARRRGRSEMTRRTRSMSN